MALGLRSVHVYSNVYATYTSMMHVYPNICASVQTGNRDRVELALLLMINLVHCQSLEDLPPHRRRVC